MRYMMMLRATESTEAGNLPTPEMNDKMIALMEDMAKAGILLGGEGLKPSSEGLRIQFKDGKVTRVIDGPFTEIKELIAGYVIVDLPSRDDILYWAERFAAVEGTGETEIRPFFELSDFPEESLSAEAAAREEALREKLIG